MKQIQRIPSIAAVAIAAALLFGLATAASAPPAERGKVVSAAKHSTAKVSSFERPFRPTRAQVRKRRAIRHLIRRSPRASIARTADADLARPVPIDGYPSAVWIVPAEDGAVCTIIPDPVDGWGAGCATAEEVADGRAMTMLGGASDGSLGDAAIVAVVVPDGAEPPVVTRSDGRVTALAVEDNVAAAVVPVGALVRSGRASIAVPDPSKFSPG